MITIEVKMIRRRYERLEPELIEEVSRKLQWFVREFLAYKRRAFAPEESPRGFAPEEVGVEWIVIEYAVDTVDLGITLYMSPDLFEPNPNPSIGYDIRHWLGKTPLLHGIITSASLSLVPWSYATHRLMRLSS